MTVTVLTWGGLFPVGKIVLATLDPYYLTVIRYGTASVLLLVILMLVEGPRALAELQRDPRRGRLLFFGTLGFAGFSLFTFAGLKTTTAEQAAVINGRQPLMMALALWAVRGIRPAKVTQACIALAFAGCVIVVSRGDLGAALVLLALVANNRYARWAMSGVGSGWTPYNCRPRPGDHR